MHDHLALATLDFLRQLKKNNNREWFQEHKSVYQHALADMTAFCDTLLELMNGWDVLETSSGKESLYRIYRDVRFSKDKTPYKSHFAAGFKREGATRRGGYYFQVNPEEAMIGGGFWGPVRDDLKRIRLEIDADASSMRKVLSNRQFKKVFGQLEGEQLKTAPQGFSRDHPDIDLLRFKQYVARKTYPVELVTEAGFAYQLSQDFKALLPFFNYMSEVLTTDLNGETIL